MAATPDYIVLRRHRDLAGRRWEGPTRRVLLVLLGLFLLAGLLNVFGQRPEGTSVANAAVKLDLYAPARLRGGLYFEARFTITARRELKKVFLVLDPGWFEGMTINTIEPSPVGEASRDGRPAFELGHIPRGQRFRLFIQLQVNPTNVGRRSQDVDLLDGNTELAHIDRTVTIFP